MLSAEIVILSQVPVFNDFDFVIVVAGNPSIFQFRYGTYESSVYKISIFVRKRIMKILIDDELH